MDTYFTINTKMRPITRKEYEFIIDLNKNNEYNMGGKYSREFF